METTFGPAYEERIDNKRIMTQMEIIREFMLGISFNQTYLTLKEIADATKIPEASVSAQLRHLRKTRFGAYRVDKRRRGQLWEYIVLSPTEDCQISLFA